MEKIKYYLKNKKIFYINYRKLKNRNRYKYRDFLLKLIKKQTICVEIGVRHGTFSDRILKILKPKHLYLIDPYLVYTEYSQYQNQTFQNGRHKYIQNKYKKQIENNQITIIRNFSENVYYKFNNNFINFLYIDGNHDYNYVKNDLNLYYSKIAKNGYISGDDYERIDGVARAVDEFIKQKNSEIKLILIKKHQFLLQKLI